MIIDGKLLASEIISELEQQIEDLKRKGITPKIAIVTIGPEDSWQAYVNQKLKLAEKLNIQTQLVNLENPIEAELLKIVEKLNNDSSVHGIIVQRPFPEHINNNTIIETISPKKDIDGFRSDSPFEVPVWLGVKRILEEILKQLHPELDSWSHQIPDQVRNDNLKDWLQSKQVVVVGQGVTAGNPITKALQKLGISPIVVRQETPNSSELLQKADIVISAVGKPVITPQDLKSGVVLIGVGLHRGEAGKLHGDYDEEAIKDIASFYTPSPGGVGPVNLSYLFKNLITAATK